ncbi:TPA: hypothetical protein ACJHHI_005424, partial [Klebsiella pneumoniae]
WRSGANYGDHKKLFNCEIHGSYSRVSKGSRGKGRLAAPFRYFFLLFRTFISPVMAVMRAAIARITGGRSWRISAIKHL